MIYMQPRKIIGGCILGSGRVQRRPEERSRGHAAVDEDTTFDHCVIDFEDGSSAQSGDEVEFRREITSEFRTVNDIGLLVGLDRDAQSESKSLDFRCPDPY